MSAASHHAAAPPLASPFGGDAAQRQRPHWSAFVLAAGAVAMAVALALVVANVPGSMFYDRHGPGKRNRNTSHDPMQMSRSIDLNMKYIQQKTGYDPDEYNGYLSSVNHSEDAIPGMSQAVVDMTAGVASIESGLSGVYKTTVQMREDMDAMLATSEHSGATMQTLDGSIGGLSGSMGDLLAQTRLLTTAMSGIEGKAAGIANKRTSIALRQAKELNGVLPDKVPPPTTSLTMPRYQAGAQ